MLSIVSASLKPGLDRRWRFALVSALGGLLWAVGQAYGLGTSSPLDMMLCRQLAAAGAWSLRLIGFTAGVDELQPQLLLLNNQPTVIVGGPCDGLVLYALLAGFVLAYPGSSQRRLWFIPLGIGALWLLNVLRIGALALNHAYSPDTLDFNHHYAFSAVAYTLLAGLWMLWARPGRTQSVGDGPQVASLSVTLPQQESRLMQVSLGFGILAGLVLANAYQDAVIATLHHGWTWLLAQTPSGGITSSAGASAVPAGITRLPLAVGAAFTGLYLLGSIVSLRLVLPASAARMVYRSYAGAVLMYAVLLAVARVGSFPAIYPAARLLLDFLVSPLPVAALLILLWDSASLQRGQPQAVLPAV